MPTKLPNGLTPQQDAFAREVAKGTGYRAAALAAGYAPRGAHTQATRLLKNVQVQAVINSVRTKVAQQVELDAATVLQGLLDNARAGAREVPRVTRDGAVIGTVPLDLAASNAAWGLLGKHLRLFVDRTEVSLDGDAQVKLTKLLDIIEREVTPEVLGRIVAEFSKVMHGAA